MTLEQCLDPNHSYQESNHRELILVSKLWAGDLCLFESVDHMLDIVDHLSQGICEN